jgi:segregation and condensation protein A
MWQVKTDIFEGPFDLLLSLIEKRKLFINDISLSQVTDEFISHLEGENALGLGEQAEFVLVASTLLLIKSKSLLPSLSLSLEEESDISNLEDRLKEYQKYVELSKHVKNIWGKNISFNKIPKKETQIYFIPDRQITLNSVYQFISEVIRNIPKKEFLPKAIVSKVKSLEEMIEDLSKRITQGLKMSFKAFSNSSTSSGQVEDKDQKIHIIVSFLAMLELVKRGIISVSQEHREAEIEMESKSVNVPMYG